MRPRALLVVYWDRGFDCNRQLMTSRQDERFRISFWGTDLLLIDRNSLNKLEKIFLAILVAF